MYKALKIHEIPYGIVSPGEKLLIWNQNGSLSESGHETQYPSIVNLINQGGYLQRAGQLSGQVAVSSVSCPVVIFSIT